MKVSFFKITALLFFLLLCGELIAQTRFGSIACDSFQVTINDSEAIIYQKNKAAVYNRAKQEFLIKPTKASVIFFKGDDLYLVADQKNLVLYNFNCADSLTPCIKKYAGASCIKFSTIEHKDIYLQQDNRKYFLSSDYLGEPDWIYQPNTITNRSSIRTLDTPTITKKVGVERINDSLLLILNYKSNYLDPESTPVKSIQYPEEDSLIYDPETGFYYAFYPSPIRGYANCGVYNLNKKEWFIIPDKFVDYYKPQGFLITEFIRFKGSNYIDSINYSFMNLQGHFLFKDVEHSELEYSPLVATIVTSSDTAIAIPNFPGAERFDTQHFQMIKDGKMAIVRSVGAFDPICKFKDFVHYNLTHDYFFWLENDSIYVELGDEKYAVSQSQGIMEIYPFKASVDVRYEAFLIEGMDTTHIVQMLDDIYIKPSPSSPKIRLEIKDGNLIINDCNQSLTSNRYKKIRKFVKEDLETLQKEYYFEYSRQSSSIWRLEKEGWAKKTDYYKSIDKLDFGYLLTEQFYYESTAYYSDIYYKPETFTIVDINFNPMEFNGYSVFTNVEITNDWIELTAEEGTFFINHQGQPINMKK